MPRELMRNTYPDEYIEKWGNIYLANPGLRRRGILFGMFLAAPEEILDACLSSNAPENLEPLPLLSQQRRAEIRIFNSINDRVEGRDAALSRRVPSHDGL